MPGVRSFAVALPRMQLKAAELQAHLGRLPVRCDAVRVAGFDEDEVTLALDAARAALRGQPAPGALVTASASAGPMAGLLLDALDLPAAPSLELRGPLAGLDALLAARDVVQAQNVPALVVTGDVPGGEGLPTGAAAGSAWLLDAKGPVQLRYAAHASWVEPIGAGEPGALLAQAVRNLTASRLGADAVAHAAGADAQPGLAAAMGKALPKARLARAGQLVGDAGSTAPLLGLAAGIEAARAGEPLVLAHAGAGRAAALAWECEARPAGAAWAAELAQPVEDLDAARALRLRSPAVSGDVSQGAAVSRASWLESLPARLRFQGQRCGAGHVQFPPRQACAQCGAAELAPFRLRGTGEAHSVTTIGRGSAPAEFAELQRRSGAYDVAIVQLAEGPRVAAMVCGAAGQLRIGDAVELVVRRLYAQDGAPRYGFKARKAAGPSPPGSEPSASERRAGPPSR